MNQPRQHEAGRLHTTSLPDSPNGLTKPLRRLPGLSLLVFAIVLLFSANAAGVERPPQVGIASSRSLSSYSAPRFQSEEAAQKHCPADTVVWVNTATGVYHYKGQRWYGNTKHGAYECKKEADAEGDRPTRNGQ
jgi:hypothetical protein